MFARVLAIVCTLALVGVGSSDVRAKSPLTATSSGSLEGAEVFGGALAGSAGAVAGFFAGWGVGRVIASGCEEDQAPDCLGAGVEGLTLGTTLGFAAVSFGAAAGVYGYGESRGLSGSLGYTVAGASMGSLLGLVVVGALGAGSDDLEGASSSGLVVGAGLSLPVIGALVGYGLSSRTGERYAPSGALIDLNPEGHLVLAPPAVDLLLAPGEVGVSMKLIAGTF